MRKWMKTHGCKIKTKTRRFKSSCLFGDIGLICEVFMISKQIRLKEKLPWLIFLSRTTFYRTSDPDLASERAAQCGLRSPRLRPTFCLSLVTWYTLPGKIFSARNMKVKNKVIFSQCLAIYMVIAKRSQLFFYFYLLHCNRSNSGHSDENNVTT